MRWLVAVEDDPCRAHLLGGGWPLIQGALSDGVIAVGEEDDFARTILSLHERGMVNIDYAVLRCEEGPEEFRAQANFHLQQINELHSLPSGRDWVRDTTPTSTLNITGLTVGQVAGRDIHNHLTFGSFVEALERAVDDTAAPANAKEEAKGLFQRLRDAAPVGEKMVQETGTEIAAKVLAQAIGLPL